VLLIEFIGLWIGNSGGLCEHGNEHLDSIKWYFLRS
jgi:hypothetical protein